MNATATTASPAPEAAPITAYKGMNTDMTCRGYQFEVGKTYEHDGPVEACASGFHACTHPQDVWGHYGPGNGVRFFEVELGGATKTHGADSKVAAGRCVGGKLVEVSE